MFLPSDKINMGELLQGDIVSDVPLFGTLDEANIQSITEAVWAYKARLKRGFCAVLSHSCEISTTNTIKVTSCILAPIRDANGATPQDKFELLKASNAISAEGTNFLKYYYIPPNEVLKHAAGSIVDISKLFSVRNTMLQALTSNKVLQMDETARLQLATKIAAYFGRD